MNYEFYYSFFLEFYNGFFALKVSKLIFTFFNGRKEMFLKLSFVSMHTIDLRFVAFFHINMFVFKVYISMFVWLSG